jgi:hypothetical protein
MKLYWTLVSAAMVGACLNDIVGEAGRLLILYWMHK